MVGINILQEEEKSFSYQYMLIYYHGKIYRRNYCKPVHDRDLTPVSVDNCPPLPPVVPNLAALCPDYCGRCPLMGFPAMLGESIVRQSDDRHVGNKSRPINAKRQCTPVAPQTLDGTRPPHHPAAWRGATRRLAPTTVDKGCPLL